MCGIAGAFSLKGEPINGLNRRLEVMSQLLAHRGPDGHGYWLHPSGTVGFAHRRLSIIDLENGAQPMVSASGSAITYNGEVYNYRELREELGSLHDFQTLSDTEPALVCLDRYGTQAYQKLRGMFALGYWDEAKQELTLLRDRFGIKPLYYLVEGDVLYFASEAKALVPMLPSLETDQEALADYLTFQLCLGGKTLFKNIRELPPAHRLTAKRSRVELSRWWEVHYQVDFDHSPRYFEHRLEALLLDSVALHLRSDVPLGAYVSGGLDSSLVASLARKHSSEALVGFNGRFALSGYDESHHAHAVASHAGFDLHVLDIGASDFERDVSKLLYHLDFPVAGPGSFPQFEVSRLAARHRKVVLGGQGGDEVFGGYARYLIAYFEQCIKGAIDGTLQSGNFVVTYESIIPNLASLRSYKPLIQSFFSKGLFAPMDERYFQLVNRAGDLSDEVRFEAPQGYSPFESFKRVFNGDNVGKASYFDLMTHFDFKTLLPALLQVEDRVSMAHGLESRVPILDHPLIEFAATMPADVKFKNGTMKEVLKKVARSHLPTSVIDRKDKMGFPVPLQEWFKGPLAGFIGDVFGSKAALERAFIDNRKVREKVSSEPQFGRKIWGYLCLELWQREFHDQHYRYKRLLTQGDAT